MNTPLGIYKPPGVVAAYDCRFKDQCNASQVSPEEESQCIGGSKGPLCGGCDDDHMIRKNGECEACDSKDLSVKIGSVIGFIFLFGMFVVLESVATFVQASRTYTVRRLSTRASKSEIEIEVSATQQSASPKSADANSPPSVRRASSAISMMKDSGLKRFPIQPWDMMGIWKELQSVNDLGMFSPLMRTILNYGQIVGLLTFVQTGKLSDSSAGKLMGSFSFLQVVSFGFMVDFFETIDCSIGQDPWGKTYTSMLIPVGLWAAIGIFILTVKVFVPQIGLGEFIRSVCFGSMVVYTSVLRSVLENVASLTVEETEYMRRDTRFEIGTEAQRGLAAGSILFCVAYGVGLPILIVSLYYRGVTGKKDPAQVAKAKQFFGFLVKGYHPEFYWWEVTVLMRRCLCVLAVVLSNDVIVQTSIIMFIVIMSIAFHSAAAPLTTGFLNFFEYLNLFCVFLSTFSTLVAYAGEGNQQLIDFAAAVYLGTQLCFFMVAIVFLVRILATVKNKIMGLAVAGSSMPVLCFRFLSRFITG